MKTHKNLLPQIAAFTNLLFAFESARQGKRAMPYVDAFSLRMESEFIRLRRELLSGSYRPGAYHNFTIFEPKERLITAAAFRARVSTGFGVD